MRAAGFAYDWSCGSPPAFLKEITAYREPDRVVQIAALCPACRTLHRFRVDKEYWAVSGATPSDVWSFNGDYERPTFHPSMGANFSGYYPDRPRCHSFLTDGVWNFLADSTHKMAGQSVAMIPIERPE